MPELPEVETFKRYFNHTSLHQQLEKVSCKTASLVKKVSCRKLNQILSGKEFSNSYRRGKFLIAKVKGSNYNIVFHFGMTGSLQYGKKENLTKKDTKYAQVIFTFKNNYQLLWINIRKFGKIYVVKELDEVSTLKKMGPEALDISKKDFMHLLSKKENKNVKSFLMSQSDIAGIGNDYSNEILFQAAIHPKTKIKSLRKAKREILYSTMKKVLKKAISIKPPEGDFPKPWLLAHKYTDMKCPKNPKHILKKSTVAGRSAIYCPEHQT